MFLEKSFHQVVLRGAIYPEPSGANVRKVSTFPCTMSKSPCTLLNGDPFQHWKNWAYL